MSNLILHDEEIQELLADCSVDTALWCQTAFPQRFWRQFGDAHRKLFDALDNPANKRIVITAHRGFGKTSIIHLGFQSKLICFRDAMFIVPVSCTSSGAILQSENLKTKLTTTPMLEALFGKMQTSKFSQEIWRTSTGTLVMPRGRQQQVRGMLHGDYRPDFILVDDFEDKESVQSEDQRKKYKEWFFSDLLGCFDVGNPPPGKDADDWRVVVIGTLLHEDSLLNNLCEDPEWLHIDVPIADPDLNPTWPEFITKPQIEAMAESFRRKGLIDLFYQEYMNQVIATEDAPVKKEMFDHYDESAKVLVLNKNIENIILVDPAKTASRKADDTAIVGVGIDTKNGTIYVRDVIAGRMHTDEIYEHIIAMAKRLNARTIGLEVTTLHEHIVYPFKNELRKRGLFYEVIELKAKGKKEERIRDLVPLYRMGYIKHNPRVTAKLEAQLLSFPRSRRDDVMDALAYIVPLLHEKNRYMLGDPDKTGGKYPGKDEEEEYKRMYEEDEELELDWTSV